MNTRLDGRVAIVTGANQGIGAAVAVELARRGADVLVAYYRFEPEPDAERPEAYRTQRMSDADAVVASCRDHGTKAVAVEADLSLPATPPMLFDRAEEDLGPVDILINNASAWRKDSFSPGADQHDRPTERVSAVTADAQLMVDARGSALMISEFSARLIARDGSWGRIVGLTSGSPRGFPGEVSYGAAKAALENYTMSAATELSDRGVTANLVHPPITDTGWVTPGIAEFAEVSPDFMGVAQPEEVATVVAWLCSDGARRVSGNVVFMR